MPDLAGIVPQRLSGFLIFALLPATSSTPCRQLIFHCLPYPSPLKVLLWGFLIQPCFSFFSSLYFPVSLLTPFSLPLCLSASLPLCLSSPPPSACCLNLVLRGPGPTGFYFVAVFFAADRFAGALGAFVSLLGAALAAFFADVAAAAFFAVFLAGVAGLCSSI